MNKIYFKNMTFSLFRVNIPEYRTLISQTARAVRNTAVEDSRVPGRVSTTIDKRLPSVPSTRNTGEIVLHNQTATGTSITAN